MRLAQLPKWLLSLSLSFSFFMTSLAFAESHDLSGLRDKRYCEILVIKRHLAKVKAAVYSTVNLNSCPASAWNKIDKKQLAQQLGATRIKLNGPRHWAIDGMSASKNSVGGPIITVNGMQLKQRADITTHLWKGIGRKFYSPNYVHRNTVWIYNAHTTVYELIDPKGNVYVMQSYSQMIDPHLTMADLKNLGSKLTLPEGWRYQVKTLDKELKLKANGMACVIADNLDNSYSKLEA